MKRVPAPQRQAGRGNSTFAHIGSYEELGGDKVVIIANTVRHNPGPNSRAMAGTDDATLFA